MLVYNNANQAIIIYTFPPSPPSLTSPTLGLIQILNRGSASFNALELFYNSPSYRCLTMQIILTYRQM